MMTMMVLFDDDRDGGDDGTSTFWYETAIKKVLEIRFCLRNAW